MGFSVICENDPRQVGPPNDMPIPKVELRMVHRAGEDSVAKRPFRQVSLHMGAKDLTCVKLPMCPRKQDFPSAGRQTFQLSFPKLHDMGRFDKFIHSSVLSLLEESAGAPIIIVKQALISIIPEKLPNYFRSEEVPIIYPSRKPSIRMS
jgi:hypothetical protein